MKLKNTLISLCSAWVLLFFALPTATLQQVGCAEQSAVKQPQQQPEAHFSADIVFNAFATPTAFQCNVNSPVSFRDNVSGVKAFAKQFYKNGSLFFVNTFTKNVVFTISSIPIKALSVILCTFLI